MLTTEKLDALLSDYVYSMDILRIDVADGFKMFWKSSFYPVVIDSKGDLIIKPLNGGMVYVTSDHLADIFEGE